MRFGAIVVAALAVSLSALAADPFVGTWKPANLDKWKISSGAPEGMKSLLATFEAVSKDQYRYTLTTSDGGPGNEPQVWPVDGVEHKSGNGGATSKNERINERHLKRTLTSSNGSFVADWVVSADGNTLTNTRKGTNLNGSPIDEIWIYEKQVDAPRIERPKSQLDLDHEFDRGSGIAITELSDIQVGNLATLAKVWGFLKYHHPAVTLGKRHWDYDLFRVMPGVLAAPDRESAGRILVKWIDGLGDVPACERCANLEEKDLVVRPDIAWISDARLPKDLRARLESIYKNRAIGQQFYVAFNNPGVRNPNFEHELSYAGRIPDAGFQLLALFRYWNIIRYWSPNREIMGADWDAVLTEFIPKVALAARIEDYMLQMMSLIARVNDTHASLSSSFGVCPPTGACKVPARVRFVEGQPVVIEGGSELKTGDIIEELDGVPVAQRIKEWTPYYADSNNAARLRDIARYMLRGDCSKAAALRIRRGSETLNISGERVKPVQRAGGEFHDLPGPGARLLNADIAYVKISSVEDVDFAAFIKSAMKTKGLIVDMRNYPDSMSMFTLGTHLVTQETPFARCTIGDASNPGAFHWDETTTYKQEPPHYSGKVVILVDEITQSSAEYHAMAFRAVPGAVVIGSTTAGADGNVSQIPLPGGLATRISGLGVFYPDGRPTQRVGIVPDKEVRPTIAGVRVGRDEVLEAALREILGPGASIPDTRPWVRGGDR